MKLPTCWLDPDGDGDKKRKKAEGPFGALSRAEFFRKFPLPPTWAGAGTFLGF
jgi:hypothetical protein